MRFGGGHRNVGRMAALLAGLPTSVPATTVHRLCGSSLDAAIIGSRTIETGRGRAGRWCRVDDPRTVGLAEAGRTFPPGDVTAVSTTLGCVMVNPHRTPSQAEISWWRANHRFCILKRPGIRFREPEIGVES
jgi:acetyl-CoA acyltransferase